MCILCNASCWLRFAWLNRRTTRSKCRQYHMGRHLRCQGVVASSSSLPSRVSPALVPGAFSLAAFAPSPASASSHPAHWTHRARESQPACLCTHAAQSGPLSGGRALSRAIPWFTSRNPVRMAKKKTPVLRYVGCKADQLLRVAERCDAASGNRAGQDPQVGGERHSPVNV